MLLKRLWDLPLVAVIGGVLIVVLLITAVAGRRGRSGPTQRAVLVAAITRSPVEAWLGLTVQPLTDVLCRELGLPKAGVIVADVRPGSPMEAAGLQVGDLLQRLDDTKIRTPADVTRVCQDLSVGDKVSMVALRQGQVVKLKANVGSAAARPRIPPATLPEPEIEVEAAWLGLDIVPLDPAEAQELDLGPAVRGMVVDDVAAGRGVDAGLAAGDVIVAVNGQPTRSLTEFKQATQEAVGALIEVLRGGLHLYITVAPPGISVAERRLMQQRLPLTQVGFGGVGP